MPYIQILKCRLIQMYFFTFQGSWYLMLRSSRRTSNLASQLHPWLCNAYASPLGVAQLGFINFLIWIELNEFTLMPYMQIPKGLSHPNVFFHLSGKFVLPEGSLQWRRCSRQSKHPDAQHIQFFFCFLLILQTSIEVLPNLLPVAMQFLQANYLPTIQEVQKVHLRKGRIYISHV